MGKRVITHLGAPALFELNLAVREVVESFDAYGCYLVGSVLERPNYRDVDIRLIMSDEAFTKEFPNPNLETASWELDSKWLLLTSAISRHIEKMTGLPIDFQFQPISHANRRHDKSRHPIGIRVRGPSTER